MQNSDTYTTTETRCNTVHETSEKVVGYDVQYQLDGRVNQVRMDHDPGAQIPGGQGRSPDPVAAPAVAAGRRQPLTVVLAHEKGRRKAPFSLRSLFSASAKAAGAAGWQSARP